MTNIGTLPRISPSALSNIILSQSAHSSPTIAIIDVRDEDHIGGHILGSTHVPSQTLDHAIPSLVHKLKDKETVVFHCALSQQRGPGAALQYLRARERLLGGPTKTTAGEAMKKSAVQSKDVSEQEKMLGRDKEDSKDNQDGNWKDVKEEGGSEKGNTQKVYVLDRGFVGWQDAYGEDERLTTGYSKEIWKDGGSWM